MRHGGIDPAADEPALNHAAGVTHVRAGDEFDHRPAGCGVEFDNALLAKDGL